MRKITTIAVGAVLGAWLFTISAPAQHLRRGRWASEDDPIAKQMIQMERDWAEDGCTQKALAGAFLADDFQGTAPGGGRYDKTEALKRPIPERA